MGNTQGVLDGDLDGFIRAYLLQCGRKRRLDAPNGSLDSGIRSGVPRDRF